MLPSRIALAVLMALCVSPTHAQSTSPQPPLPDSPQQQTPETEAQRNARIHAEGDREVHTEEGQRIAVIVPNFNTVLNGRGVALSPGQKTRLAVRATLDPFNVLGAFFLAGLSEVQDDDRGYGWGAPGYFKRAGANYLDVVDGTMLAGAVYPILLHQDPRYFRQGAGTLHSRIRHALLAPFLCRGDDGHRQFNFSNVLGNYTAGAISNAYYPAGTRGVSHTLANGSIVLVEGSLGNIGLEFAPDVTAWWKRRRASRTRP